MEEQNPETLQEQKRGPCRRSRSVREGRNWECTYCGRSYFKCNSLTWHVRLKHSEEAGAVDFLRSLVARPQNRPPYNEEASVTAKEASEECKDEQNRAKRLD